MQAPRRKVAGIQRAGVVTALVPRRGRFDRVVVYVDGAKSLDLAVDLVAQEGVKRGDRLEVEQQERLLDLDAPNRAKDRALALLASRDRSRYEIETRLQVAGFPPDVIEETLAWLVERGYVDDMRFARAYLSERRRAGWGDRRVRAELRSKGVSPSVVGEALDEGETVDEKESEGHARVEALARRRFLAQFESDPKMARRRLAGFLSRRGYDWDTISEIERKLRLEAGGGDLDVDPGES
jgi:regulatory protein